MLIAEKVYKEKQTRSVTFEGDVWEEMPALTVMTNGNVNHVVNEAIRHVIRTSKKEIDAFKAANKSKVDAATVALTKKEKGSQSVKEKQQQTSEKKLTQVA